MSYQVPTIVAADDPGNDANDVAWEKMCEFARAASAGQMQLKNLLHNGDFAIAARGTTFAITSSDAPVVDRWKGRRASVAGATMSRVNGFSGAQYALRSKRNAADTATNTIFLGQQIESANAIRLAGKKAVLSADLKAGADFSASGSKVFFRILYGTGIDESRAVNANFATGGAFLTAQSVTISTTAARYELIFDIPSTATELAVEAYWAPVGTAGTNDHFDITNVQLEEASADDPIGTPFDHRPHALERALCARFLQSSFSVGTTPANNVGTNTGEFLFQAFGAGATTQRSPRVALQRMRAAPSVTIYGVSSSPNQVRDETAAAHCTSAAVVNAAQDGFAVTCTGAAGTAVGNHLGFHWLASAEF